MSHRRRVASAVLAVLAAGALGACTSQPGNRRVVSDVIESLRLPEDQEACMMERLDEMTDDQLAEIADNNETWDPSGQGDTPADATEGMRLFIDTFHECTTEEGGAGSTGSTEITAETDSTTPVETTEG